MKQMLTLLLIALPMLMPAAIGKENRNSPHETVKGKNVSITYGRPYKKGREIFGALVPYNTIWRAGADEATEITVDKNCSFGDKRLKPGTYTMFIVPGEKEWTIILNSKLGEWGAFNYEKIKKQDVLKTKVPVNKLPETVDQLTMSPTENGTGIYIQWDKSGVFIPMVFTNGR